MGVGSFDDYISHKEWLSIENLGYPGLAEIDADFYSPSQLASLRCHYKPPTIPNLVDVDPVEDMLPLKPAVPGDKYPHMIVG